MRTQAPGALEKSFEKSSAEKAGDVCTLLFAELPTGRRPCASTTPPTPPLHDLLTEAVNPGSAFATAQDLGNRHHVLSTSQLHGRSLTLIKKNSKIDWSISNWF